MPVKGYQDVASHDNLGVVDFTQSPITFAERLGVGSYLYFLTPFLPGYTGLEITDISPDTQISLELYLWP